MTSPIFTPGKDACTRQAATRPLCSKRIVGYAMAEHMRTELVQDTLEMAMRNSLPVKGATSWIELCCNQTKLHSSIGYRSTNEVNQDTKENRDNSLTKTQVFHCRPENL